MIKIYHYMKSKEDTVDVQITYKCLHICTCLSNLKLVMIYLTILIRNIGSYVCTTKWKQYFQT